MFNNEQREEIYKIFAECFHDVIVPLLEEKASKDDIARLEKKVAGIETKVDGLQTKVDGINSKLDKVLDNQNKQLQILGKYNERIASLENRLNN
ncbi:MAG: hypothetical protein HYW33_00840 [Candidatus Blackburnbacteria bacterium]|nr:hypothetical protein [Candidatus Blackburnbacteria bacterium]